MSREIRINYEEVYAKTAELRQRITTELREMDGTYRQCQSSLRRMDSRTNAEFIESMEINQQKSRVATETLTKLLSFIETASRQVERDEATLARGFSRSRVISQRR